MLQTILNLKEVTALEKVAQKSINGGGINSCIRRHQRLIIRAQEAEPFDEEQRETVISGFVEDAKRCYDGTNVL